MTDITALKQQLAGAGLTHGPVHDALDELERTRAERDEMRARLRWNIEDSGNLVRVCRGDHDKSEDCSLHEEVFVPEADRDRLAGELAEARALVARLVDAAQPFADVAYLFDSEVEGVGAHDTLSLWLNGDDEEPAWRAADFNLGDFGTLCAALATRGTGKEGAE